MLILREFIAFLSNFRNRQAKGYSHWLPYFIAEFEAF